MHIRQFLLFLLLLAAQAAGSQTLDALYLVYNAATGKAQVEAANRLFAKAKKQDVVDTLYNIRGNAVDSAARFHVEEVMLFHYYDAQEFEKAAVHGARAVEQRPRSIDNEAYAEVLSCLAASCQRTGNLFDALHYQRECYQLDLASGDEEAISSSLNNLAALYLTANQPEEAVPLIEDAIKIERRLGNDARLAISLGIASEVYLKLQQSDKALQRAQEAYRLDNRDGRRGKAAIRLTQLAAIHIDMQRYDEAEREIAQALPQLRADNNRNSLAIAYFLRGRINTRRHNTKQAEADINAAIAICREIGNRNVEKNCWHALYELHRDGNHRQALQALERYVVLDDSINSDEASQLQRQFMAQYQAQELREDNADLLEENAHHRRTRLWLILALTLLGAGAAVALWLGINMLRKRTRRIRSISEQSEAHMHFFTNLTHEFRTPLTVINGMSRLISEQHYDSEEEVEKAARAIYRQGERLERLTNQILDISKLKTVIGIPQYFHDDILPQLAMIVESFQPYADTRKIALDYRHPDHPVVVDFEPDYFRKMIANLLSNAFKFTAAGDSITLSISAPTGNTVQLQVADTGVGIKEETLPHVFELFYQGHHDSKTIGTGIGLALVKEIVDAMQGNITVESELGKGTTFTVSLPVRQGRTVYPPLADNNALPTLETYRSNDGLPLDDGELPDDDTTNALPTLLIVEDNADVSAYIQSLLQNEYTLLFAADGQEGLEKARQHIPDLILTDLMMPNLSGEQLLHEVRQTEVLSHIPVIIVTAKTELSDRLNVLSEGADAYLYKPFSADELRVRVRQLIQQRRNLRDTFAYALQRGTENTIELNDTNRTFLRRLQDVVAQLLREGNLSVEQVASEMCLSKRQLLRKVQALTGETTVAYIMHLRLQQAKRLIMEHPSVPIVEIAMKCGFDDAGHFSKAFKQKFNASPSEMRGKKS